MRPPLFPVIMGWVNFPEQIGVVWNLLYGKGHIDSLPMSHW